MNAKDFEKAIKSEFLEAAKKEGISRREALKIFASATAMMGIGASGANAATEAMAKSSAKGKILIIGGGSGGIDMAARLVRALENPDITLVDPNDYHYYQPGFTLIGCGVYTEKTVTEKQADYVPSAVKWIKDIVVSIDPDNNTAQTEKNGALTYDYLVLAPGIQMNFDKLEGISRERLGEDNVHCIYDLHGAIKTWDGVQAMAKKGSGKMLFCDTNTPIKCGGAPKKINLMSEDYMRKEGVRDNMEIALYTASGKMFGVPEFEKRLGEIYQERNIGVKFRTLFKGIDRSTKEAIFETTEILTREEFDEVLGEKVTYTEEKKSMTKEQFDFLHFTPPMSAPDFVKNSPLAWDRGSAKEGGWAMVDKNSLVHLKYKNVVAVGDVAGIPINKTGGSVRKQAPVATTNLIDIMEGREPSASHKGYTVCPILVCYGKVLLAEFGYEGLMPTLPFIEPAKERWMWWIMKRYILHPLYYYGMLRGIA